MALFSVFLQTGDSLFPHPLESSLHRTSNLPHKLWPWYGSMVNKMSPTLYSTGNCPKFTSLYQWTNSTTAQNTSFKITLKSNINTVMTEWGFTSISSWNIRLKILPTLLEVCLRYILYCQIEAFYEDEYDQIKELQNGKYNLVFRVVTK